MVRVCRPPNARTPTTCGATPTRAALADFQAEDGDAPPATRRTLLGADIVGNEAGDVQLAAPHSEMTDRQT